jgi:hypothetical protein
MGVITLTALILGSYLLYQYLWVPIGHFNSRPFGYLEYTCSSDSFRPLPIPDDSYASTAVGQIDVGGWVLDRSGIRAVEVYIDDVKVAEAQYGAPSPEVYQMYPHMAGADHAAYSAQRIDTTRFSNGLHVLVVKAVNQKGVWANVSDTLLRLINENPYNFWAHWPEAQRSQDDAVEQTTLSLNEPPRQVLLQRANTTLTFDQVPVYEGGALQLGLALANGLPPGRGAALVLEIVADREVPLFATTIQPDTSAQGPTWNDTLVDLSQFANEVISLTFIVRSPLTDDSDPQTVGQVAWSRLRINYPGSGNP